MSDLAAAQAEADEATRPPRFSLRQGLIVAVAGSAAIGFLLTWLAVFGGLGPLGLGGGERPLWVLLLAALAYSMGLLVWAGMWKRPSQAAAIIGASLVGLLAGYMAAIFVANLVSGPDV